SPKCINVSVDGGRVVGLGVIPFVEPTPVNPPHFLVRRTDEDAVNPVDDGVEVVLQACDIGVTPMARQVAVDVDALGGGDPLQSILENVLPLGITPDV